MSREVWETLGADDPDWAVLTHPDKRHGGWDGRLDEFYATGQAEVDSLLEELSLDRVGSALDWGSGTGRLSFALATKADRVTSVDVSASMLAALTRRAAERGIGNVRPVLVEDHVPQADHDLAVSLLVLQHLPSRPAVDQALRLIAGSVRPGGTALVEIPEQALTGKARVQPRYRAYRAARLLGVPAGSLHRCGLSGISMVTMPRERVRSVLASAGLRVVSETDRSEHDYRYVRYAAEAEGA